MTSIIKRNIKKQKLIKTIDQFDRIEDIARAFNCSRQNIYQRLNEYNLLNTWQEKLKQKIINKLYNQKNKKENIESIVNQLTNLALQKAIEIDIPTYYATFYLIYMTKKSQRCTYENVKPLFENYFNAILNNEKKSLTELSENTIFLYPETSKILHKVGLMPFNIGKKRYTLPTEVYEDDELIKLIHIYNDPKSGEKSIKIKHKIIDRSIELHLCIREMMYILECSPESIRTYLDKSEQFEKYRLNQKTSKQRSIEKLLELNCEFKIIAQKVKCSVGYVQRHVRKYKI